MGLAFLFAVHFNAVAGEKTDFATAKKMFDGGFYPQAESKFAEYTASYTNSPRLGEAYFCQAYSRLFQTNSEGLTNYDGALELLRSKLDLAGDYADQYQFWIAETLFRKGVLKEAADDWGGMVKAYPESPLRLRASHNQALAFSKLGDWRQVIELLGNEKGDFQVAAKETKTDEWAENGFLLLAEAYFRESQYAAGEKVLLTHPASTNSLRRHQLLLCRIQLADSRPEDALVSAGGIPAPLPGKRQNAEKAETLALKGEIYESLGQLTNAVAAYTNNLDLAAPVDYQRIALFKTVDLTLKQHQIEQAIAFLTDFIEKRPANDPSLDIACLSLGELKLRTATPVVLTNLLQEAITNLSRVVLEFTNSPLRGKAYLDRGWCYWTQGDMGQARINFYNAVELLTSIEDKALARFKLADAQFAQQAYDEAVANYKMVLDACDKSAALKNSLFSKAQYQLVRASIEKGDSATAGTAVTNIVDWFPDTLGNFTDETLLLWGEFKSQKNNYSEARDTFFNLIKKFPDTPVLPEVRYAIARSYVQEGNWTAATASFDQWVTNFPGNQLMPQAEFSRALAYEKSGMDYVSLELFTNFVTRFPSNNLAPWAQNWVADYYFNQGAFIDADKNYKALVNMLQARHFDNVGDLVYQARLMVGRSAFARDELGEASKNFAGMISPKDTNMPPTVLAQAYFALGDICLRQYRENLASKTNTYCDDAVNAFSWITNNASSTALAPLAMGKIGDCNFEWATQNTNNLAGFTNAMRAYETVLQMPQTTASTHNEAEVKFGLVLEALNKPEEALLHYLNVLDQMDPSRQDPVWVKEAGLKAARLCKARGQWGKAVNVYKRVLDVIPSLRSALEEEINKANAQINKAQ